jgi:hypothetical protein
MRTEGLLDKTNRLLHNSSNPNPIFGVVDNTSIEQGLIELIRHYENDRVYVLHAPTQIIDHPLKNTRRLIDPLLRDTPEERVFTAEVMCFEHFYEITSFITDKLFNNHEVFIHSILKQPDITTLNHRYLLKFFTINMTEVWGINEQVNASAENTNVLRFKFK